MKRGNALPSQLPPGMPGRVYKQSVVINRYCETCGHDRAWEKNKKCTKCGARE